MLTFSYGSFKVCFAKVCLNFFTSMKIICSQVYFLSAWHVLVQFQIKIKSTTDPPSPLNAFFYILSAFIYIISVFLLCLLFLVNSFSFLLQTLCSSQFPFLESCLIRLGVYLPLFSSHTVILNAPFSWSLISSSAACLQSCQVTVWRSLHENYTTQMFRCLHQIDKLSVWQSHKKLNTF